MAPERDEVMLSSDDEDLAAQQEALERAAKARAEAERAQNEAAELLAEARRKKEAREKKRKEAEAAERARVEEAHKAEEACIKAAKEVHAKAAQEEAACKAHKKRIKVSEAEVARQTKAQALAFWKEQGEDVEMEDETGVDLSVEAERIRAEQERAGGPVMGKAVFPVVGHPTAAQGAKGGETEELGSCIRCTRNKTPCIWDNSYVVHASLA